MMAGDKPFTLDAPQYDQSAWAGRVKHFFTVTNPIFLFTRYASVLSLPVSLCEVAAVEPAR
jgi:hypothetical protein